MSTPSAPPAFRVHAVQGWQRALLWPLGLLMRWWGRSLHFDLSPADEAAIRKRDETVAIVLWHNRLFIAGEVFRRYRQGRPLYALVSASKDGAWLAAFFGLVGIRAVRGSSSRGGREAANTLVEVMRAGHDIGITPDGPRGPLYDCKAGGLVVTRRARAAVLVLGAGFESAWRLRSWDRFYLPRPFSRVRVRCEYLPAAALAGDRDEALALLARRLHAVSPDPVGNGPAHPVV